MKVEIEQLKTLVENGDKAALETYIISGIEKSDVETVSKTNVEVKSYFDSEKDTHANKHLETWKTNQLPGLIEAKVREANPTKTPAEIALEDLQKKFDDSEKSRTRETLKNKALSVAAEKKLPANILDFFIADDEDGTNANLEKLESEFNAAVQAAVESKFVEGGRNPKGGNPPNTSVGASFAKNANDQSKPVEATLWD